MKAYVCCVKRRVASAGPLSEHNSAFDIRSVRDRIERDRVRGRRRSYCAVYGPARSGGREKRDRRRTRALPPPLREGRQELGRPPRVRWTADAWNRG